MQRSTPVTAPSVRRAAVAIGAKERSGRSGTPAAAFIDGPVPAGYGDVPLRTPAARVKHKGEEGAPPGQGLVQIIPKDREEARSAPAGFGAPGTHTISTVLRKGRPPDTVMGGHAPQRGDTHHQIVGPAGLPTTGNASNDCTPAASTISFDAVSADAANWRADVQSLTLQGVVNVAPWPSNPTSTATPNTANPVDGGNITAANFQSAIDDMADYNTVGGGRGPNWHSTATSSAHEWAHWNTDWIKDSVNSAAGGNWSKANQEIDAITQPKASSATAADAKTAMQGRVNARLLTFNNAAITRWNAIPDTAGVAGSTGYIAGAAVLATLIGSVRTYATTKGWAGAPPAAGP